MRQRSSRNLWRLCVSGVGDGGVGSVGSGIGGAADDVAVVVAIGS